MQQSCSVTVQEFIDGVDENMTMPWADGNDAALQDAAAPALVYGKQYSMTQRASSIRDSGA